MTLTSKKSAGKRKVNVPIDIHNISPNAFRSSRVAGSSESKVKINLVFKSEGH